MPHGTVTWFDADKGFGFLTPDDGGPDVFVHARDVLTSGSGPKALGDGQPVDFEVVEGDRGPQAREVRPTGPAPVEPPQLGTLATVSWFDAVKGYGFASPDGGKEEVFVHATSVVTGAALEDGQRVALVVVAGERGPQAQHVVPLPSGAGTAVAAVADGADGTVNWYDPDKGFGFLTPDAGGPDVFAHFRALAAGVEALTEGQRVAFSVVEGDRGPQARDVRPVDRSAPAAEPRRDPKADPRSGGRTASARAGEGTVVRYDEARGFGFLRPDDGGDDLFVHVSVLRDAGPLQVGERVRFGVRQSDRGPQADRVERA